MNPGLGLRVQPLVQYALDSLEGAVMAVEAAPEVA